MIIRFDSGKQRDYWCILFLVIVALGWIFKSIFKYYEEEIVALFATILVLWILIGKYLLRYLFKIR